MKNRNRTAEIKRMLKRRYKTAADAADALGLPRRLLAFDGLVTPIAQICALDVASIAAPDAISFYTARRTGSRR